MKMRARNAIFLGLVTLAQSGLVACATLPPDVQAVLSQPVELALSGSPNSLKRDADEGDATAQLAYSYVLRYGLNGEAVDASEASHYRALATASRGSTSTAIYVPGALKAAGHTQIINLPQYDVNETEAATADNCAAALDRDARGGNVGAQLESGVCGGQDAFDRLKSLWARASGH